MFISIIKVILGIVALLVGISIMPKGLGIIGKKTVKNAITFFTANPLSGLITGTIITAIIQSSSAVTVISISLINKGLMSFSQGIGIVLGTNIGTTITAQIIAIDFPQFNAWLLVFPFLFCLTNSPKLKAFGYFSLGLGLIFFGLNLFENSFVPLKDSFSFLEWFMILDENHFLALLTGIFVTALFQSSSAVIGLTILLGEQGLFSLPIGITIILGSNLGTCVTALIAASASNLDAKRMALAHILLNSFGIVLFFPFVKYFAFFITLLTNDFSKQIAHSHSFYNIICSLLILPFIHQFTYIIKRLLPDL